MSFSRTKYDNDATDLYNKRTTDIGEYAMFSENFTHENECRVEKGPRNSRSDVVHGDIPVRTDIESQIQNRHVPLNDNNEQHNEYLNNKDKLNQTGVCAELNQTNDEFSRHSHPLTDYRGMSTLKNHIVPFLHVSPQDFAMTDDDLRKGEASRLTVKDSSEKLRATANMDEVVGSDVEYAKF